MAWLPVLFIMVKIDCFERANGLLRNFREITIFIEKCSLEIYNYESRKI
jgi:hypothetical protein